MVVSTVRTGRPKGKASVSPCATASGSMNLLDEVGGSDAQESEGGRDGAVHDGDSSSLGWAGSGSMC